ncbi:MAG: dephospho-CoA kinase [Planctomycetales bacterium]|nr:dephospho-CoA kinase [Planctomycetales bacterium]
MQDFDCSSPPYVLGLLGGVAAGKSWLSKSFADCGIETIDADQIVHRLLQQPSVAAAVVEQFPAAGDPSGAIVRGKLAEIIFRQDRPGQAARRWLENLLHPLVRVELLNTLNSLQSQLAPPLAVVLDVPLLIEAHLDLLCTALIFVDTPLALRQERALKRGWTAEHFALREASQISLEQKMRQATHIFPGNATRDETRMFCENLLRELDMSSKRLKFNGR